MKRQDTSTKSPLAVSFKFQRSHDHTGRIIARAEGFDSISLGFSYNLLFYYMISFSIAPHRPFQKNPDDTLTAQLHKCLARLNGRFPRSAGHVSDSTQDALTAKGRNFVPQCYAAVRNPSESSHVQTDLDDPVRHPINLITNIVLDEVDESQWDSDVQCIRFPPLRRLGE
jgi:hypothetical protein